MALQKLQQFWSTRLKSELLKELYTFTLDETSHGGTGGWGSGDKDLSGFCSISWFARWKLSSQVFFQSLPWGRCSFSLRKKKGFLVLVRLWDLIYKVKGAWRSRSGKRRTEPNPSQAIQGCCHLVAGSAHAKVTGDIFPAGKFPFEVRSFLRVSFSWKEQGASSSYIPMGLYPMRPGRSATRALLMFLGGLHLLDLLLLYSTFC